MPVIQNRSNTLEARDCWLYAISSPNDLARRLSKGRFQLTAEELRRFAEDTGNFKLFTVKTKKGSEREVQQPKLRLQFIHLRIHKLLSRVAVPSYLHSAIRGRSYLSNAAAHENGVSMVKADVKKFFASVPRVKVYHFFLDVLKCRGDVAGLLADILTFDKHLATGSSASPIISYYAFKNMFDKIQALAVSKNLKMTCYIDDMALSGNAAGSTVLNEVRKIIAEHGLKTHKKRMFSPTKPKVVTGVCLTKNGSKVPNALHLKIKQGFEDLRKSPGDSKVLNPLLGRLEAAGQIEPVFKARASTLRNSMKSSGKNAQVRDTK